MNSGNAGLVGSGRISIQVPSVDENLPSIRLVESRHYLDERRFAGSVFTEQGIDLTRSYLEVNIVKGNDTREEFGNAFGDEHGLDQRTGGSDGFRGHLRFVVHCVLHSASFCLGKPH